MKDSKNKILMYAMCGILIRLIVSIIINIPQAKLLGICISVSIMVLEIIIVYLCSINNKYAGWLGLILGLIFIIDSFTYTPFDNYGFIAGWVLFSAGLNYTIEARKVRK